MDTKNLVKAILDYSNNSLQKYSKEEARNSIYDELIAANGGSTKLTLKSFRDNKDLYGIIEELVVQVASEGLVGAGFPADLVDQRNVAEGDSIDFQVDRGQLFAVSEVSRGNTGLRRQRVSDLTSVTVRPIMHGVKVYDELSRVLAGRVDITVLTDRVRKSISASMVDDAFAAWNKVTSGDIGSSYYPTVGSYSEAALREVIQHVSADNNGAPCYLLATLAGASAISAGEDSSDGKNSIYNNGYLQKWKGVPVVIAPQRHFAGTSTFAFNDKKIFVLPMTMDRPIKQVIGGDAYLKVGDGTENADLSVEITCLTAWGTAVVIGNKFGIYELS